MPTFRKKPIEIQAVQWTGQNLLEVDEFLGGRQPIDVPEAAIRLITIHGDAAWARPGDWIIPEPVRGRFYPCAPDIFAATYDPVPSSPEGQEGANR